jgi:hypothetical protein
MSKYPSLVPENNKKKRIRTTIYRDGRVKMDMSISWVLENQKNKKKVFDDSMIGPFNAQHLSSTEPHAQI